MALRCTSCLTELSAEARFCSQCGAPAGAASAARPGSLSEGGTLGADCCTACGAPLDPVSGLCLVCGSPQTTSGTAPRAEAGTPDGETDFGELQFDDDPAGPTPAPTPAQAVALDPAVDHLVLLGAGGGLRPWELRRPYYSIGRAGAKISLSDPRVSRRHLALALVGGSWVVIRLADKRMRVNGLELRQKTLHPGDLIRIGDSWLAFLARADAGAGKGLRPMAGKQRKGGWKPTSALATLGSLEEEEPTAELSVLEAGRRLGSSTGLPLVVGSHPACSIRLSGPGIAPFHTLLTWLEEGVHLMDLNSGAPARLDGVSVREQAIRDGQELGLGGHTLTLRLTGDIRGPAAAEQARRRGARPAFQLSAVYGPHRDETGPLPVGQSLVLGRGPEADLSLPREPALRPAHLELTSEVDGAGTASVRVRSLVDPSGVVINREPLEKPVLLHGGEVIQLGTPAEVAPTALLLHLALDLDAW